MSIGMKDMTPALEAEGLTVSYGRTPVVRGLKLQVPRGSVYALLGRNGAGKTSVLRVLLGERPPAAGHVRVLGGDPWSRRTSLMERIGVVPEQPNAPPEMTSAQLSIFCSRLYRKWDRAAVIDRLTRFDVPQGRPFGSLSKGQKGAVMLALALGHSPELLLLDDPILAASPADLRIVTVRGIDADGRRIQVEGFTEPSRSFPQELLIDTRSGRYLSLIQASDLVPARWPLPRPRSPMRSLQLTFADHAPLAARWIVGSDMRSTVMELYDLSSSVPRISRVILEGAASPGAHSLLRLSPSGTTALLVDSSGTAALFSTKGRVVKRMDGLRPAVWWPRVTQSAPAGFGLFRGPDEQLFRLDFATGERRVIAGLGAIASGRIGGS
jgi:ABC-type branched-subunit amino acid transport system ATPase component